MPWWSQDPGAGSAPSSALAAGAKTCTSSQRQAREVRSGVAQRPGAGSTSEAEIQA